MYLAHCIKAAGRWGVVSCTRDRRLLSNMYGVRSLCTSGEYGNADNAWKEDASVLQFSFSRMYTLEECPKKYWYNYIAVERSVVRKHPSEWDPLTSKLYLLKSLTSMPLISGDAVHVGIEACLKKSWKEGTPLHRSVAEEAATARLDELLKPSYDHIQKRDIFEESLKNASTLEKSRLVDEDEQDREKGHGHTMGVVSDVYFKKDEISEESLHTLKEDAMINVKKCLDNFFESTLVKTTLGTHQGNIFGVEKADMMKVHDYERKVSYNVRCIIDFYFQWGEKKVVLDWKTGRKQPVHMEQLYIYAMLAHKKWGVPLEDLLVVPVYLKNNRADTVEVDQESITYTEKKLIDVCRDVVDRGKDPLRFPHTDAKWKCKFCTFREICQGSNYDVVSRENLESHPAVVGPFNPEKLKSQQDELKAKQRKLWAIRNSMNKKRKEKGLSKE